MLYKFLRQNTRTVNIKLTQQICPVRISDGTQDYIILVFLTIYLLIPEKLKDSSQKRLHPLCFTPSNLLFTTYPTNQHFTTCVTGGGEAYMSQDGCDISQQSHTSVLI